MFRCKVIFLLWFVVSCSSGGVSGGSSVLGSSTPSIIDSSLGEEIMTEEYNISPNMSNLSLVNAYLYNNPSNISDVISGKNIKIALLDSGIGNHSQINDNVIANFNKTGNSLSHYSANFNAGIIAAVRDGNDIHGVAFNSKIIDIKTHTVANSALYSDISWITNGLSDASNQNAHISYIRNDAINSFSDPVLLLNFKNKVSEVTSANMVVVSDTGDVYGNDYDPYKIASIAQDTSVTNGLMLVVASLGSDSNIASDSRYCTGVKEFCLSVNSHNLSSLGLENGTTMVGNYNSGAGATVSGVLALMMEAFPATSKADLITLMKKKSVPKFTDAEVAQGLSRNIGSVGDLSDVYGWGTLSISDIFTPAGSLTIATSNIANKYPLATSVLEVPSHISNMGISDVLQKVMVLDSYNRPFWANLSHKVQVGKRKAYMDNVLFDVRGAYEKLSFYSDKMNLVYRNKKSVHKLEELDFSFVNRSSRYADFFITQGNLAFFNIGHGESYRQDETFKDPILPLTTSLPLKIGFHSRFDRKYSFSSSVIRGQDDKRLLAIKNSIKYINDFAEFGVDYTVLQQSKQFLDMRGSGAFELEDNKTNYYGIISRISLSKDVDLGFNYYESRSMLQDGSGVISELDVRSRSYNIYLDKKLSNHSSFSLSYKVPFHIYQGNIQVNIPSSLNSAGEVMLSKVNMNIMPKNYEIIQLDYKKKIDSIRDIKLSLVNERSGVFGDHAAFLINYTYLFH